MFYGRGKSYCDRKWKHQEIDNSFWRRNDTGVIATIPGSSVINVSATYLLKKKEEVRVNYGLEKPNR